MLKLTHTPIALVLGSILSTPSFAAESQIENSTAQDDIVISASRIASKRIESGSAITVLDEQYLKENQARSVAELLRDVSGVSVASSGGLGQPTSVFIRGAEAKNTLVIIDGIKVNDLANFDGSYSFAHLMADNIERIEILKGSQSALWGSDAMGGVINIVTKKGKAGFNPTASVEIGENNYHKESINLSGAAGNSHYSLSVSNLETDGISATTTDPDDDGYKNKTVALKAGHQFTEIFAIDGVLRYNDADTDYDVGYSTSRHRQAKLNTNLVLFNKQWQNRLSVAFSDSENEWNNSGEYNGEKIKTDLQSDYYLNTVNNYTQRISFIAEHENDQYQSWGATQEYKMKASGLVLGYGADWEKTIFFNTAIRRDFNDKFGDTTTYHIDLSAWVSDGTRLHASQGTGVKNPTFSLLYGYGANPDLDPEESLSWDAGVEYNFADIDAYIDLSYFDSRYTDMHTSSGVWPNSTYINLDDKATARGVEFTGSLRMTEDFRASAGYTYMETDDGSSDHKELARRPKHSASINANYKYTPKLSANIGARYVGSRRDSVWGVDSTLDSYTVITIAAAYQVHKHITLSGRIENAFDKDYEEVAGYNTDPLTAYVGISFK